MKTLLTTIILLMSLHFSAQEVSNEIKNALKNDNATLLKKVINNENLNTCFNAGNSKYTLLILTLKYNTKACFELLINEKVDVNKECSGKTPLIYAAKYGRLKMAKRLIRKGADSTLKYKGRTALAYAKKYKKTALIAYLESL